MVRTFRSRSHDGSVTRLLQAATIAGAAWGGLATTPAYAGPEGEQIVIGDVTFIRDGNRTIIQASDGSIINYISFDVLPWETVQFIQPDQMSRVLNRITGPDPTVFAGRLLSNGQVYIVNPAGVYFDGTAVVDVGGLYAAAGHISNEDFLSHIDRFTGLTGQVVNNGLIQGTDVHLMGERVENHGTVASGGGVITMLAGDNVILTRHGERISVRLDGHDITDQAHPHAGGTGPSTQASAGVVNTGTVTNAGGQIVFGAGDLYSLAIRNSGTVEAAGGDITLAATDGMVWNDGLLDASVAQGDAGSITLQGPAVLNSGEIRADAESGRAGSIELTSSGNTYLTGGSVISAAGGRGHADGGEVRINSEGGRTVFSTGALLDVSGGLGGGHGGFAEVSGHALTFNGDVLLSAQEGYDVGTLLIDPENIYIVATMPGANDGDVVPDGMGGWILPLMSNMGNDSFISAAHLNSLMGNILLQANVSIFVQAALDLMSGTGLSLEAMANILVSAGIHLHGGDLSLNAGNGMSIEAPITMEGGHALLQAGVAVLIFDDISGGTSLTIDSGDFIILGAPTLPVTLTTTGTQEFFGRLAIGDATVLNASEAIFHDQVLTAGLPSTQKSLTINGNARFDDNVGDGPVTIFSLTVNGDTIFQGGGQMIVTEAFQNYNGAVTLLGDAMLQSLAGGDIRFGGELGGLGVGSAALDVMTAGVTRFEGPVGSFLPLGRITTDAPGTTVIGADMTAGELEFGDAVTLGATVRLTGLGSVLFDSTIAGAGHSLSIDSPQTTFRGDAAGLDVLETDAAGTTLVDDADLVARRIAINDQLDVNGSVLIQGDESVDLAGSVDGMTAGAGALHVVSDERVHFGGDVGGTRILSSLTVDSGGTDVLDRNTIVFDGSLVQANGDILLNIGGKSAPAQVASVAATGDLTLRSMNGNVQIGPNEKLTALGNLSIEAQNGTATFGDLNSGGNIDVLASTIELRRRAAGSLIDFSGLLPRLIMDGGTDLVAMGHINFSGGVNLIGSGATPLALFGAPSTLSGVSIFPFAGANSTVLRRGSGPILDLAVTVAGTDVATALGTGPAPPQDRTPRDAVDLVSTLNAIAVYLRDPRSEELRTLVGGLALYSDMPRGGLVRDAQSHTVRNRLRRPTVRSVAEEYLALFLRERIDPETGRPVQEDRCDEIRTALARAWDDYVAKADERDFRTFLAETPEHLDASVYVEDLCRLCRNVMSMGVTPREEGACMQAMLGPIVPASMDVDRLREALGVSGG